MIPAATPEESGPRPALLILLAAITALGSLALNIYLPSLPVVQAEFGVSLAEVQVTVSFAMFSFAMALIVFGPLSDHFGRRPVVFLGLIAFIAGSLGALFATSIVMLSTARVVQSIGAAVAFIVARAVVADLSPRDTLQRSVAQMTMLMLVAQMVAPLLGGFIMAAGSWRSIQLALLMMAAVATLFAVRGFPESLPSSARDGRALRALFVPSLALLRRPQFRRHLLQFGVLCSTFPAFVSIAPHLMVDVFHRPPTEYGMYFILVPLGYFTGNLLVMRRKLVLDQRALILLGCSIGIVSSLAGMALLAIGLTVPLTLFLSGGFVLNFGLGLALPAISTRAIEDSRPNTASGWSLVGASQQFVSALCVQLLGSFSEDSAYPVLAFCALASLLVLSVELLADPHAPHA